VVRTKWQPTDWEKIFTNPTTDRGLISKIYKELRKLDRRETNNPIKKWGSELNKEFTAEECRMAEKHLKKCSQPSPPPPLPFSFFFFLFFGAGLYQRGYVG